MDINEFKGKKLLGKYSIPLPRHALVKNSLSQIDFLGPYAIKAQILSGERKKVGGVLFASSIKEVKRLVGALLGQVLKGEKVVSVLVEEKIPSVAEYYVSFSYDTITRGSVLMLSSRGGSDIAKAEIFPIDPTLDTPFWFLREALKKNDFPSEDIIPMSSLLQNLWRLFLNEHALLVEINPVLKMPSGQLVAVDAKIILDDEKINPHNHRIIDLHGDIAVLASGGGASLLNTDTLLLYGGRPANYTEYSGNPPAEVVKNLTKRILAKKGLKGCWVVGGIANFTDIYETMRGFLEGLQEVRPKPRYPFVIRRDGPRQKEAFVMLKNTAAKEGYDFHLFDSEVSMSESAKIMVRLAYKK